MTAAGSVDRDTQLAALFRGERKRLWGRAYRLTGNAEDADDVVQDAFARLLAQPADTVLEQPGPWLARVTTNLGIDALRRRRRRSYVGPWLPSPIETGEMEDVAALPSESPDSEARYGLAESVTYAFLLALELLGPRQRAVLVLRDVLGNSARETAEILGTSEGNVRVLHSRARRALDEYDRERCIPTPELCARHGAVLRQLLDCLLAQDASGLEALLAESVFTLTDAAGEYTALAAPLVGRPRVARFYLAATLHRRETGMRTEICTVNGLPAVLVTLERPVRRQAPRSLLRCELDANGRIRLVEAILAPRKLSRLAARAPV